MNAKRRSLLLDTEATNTIVRQDLLARAMVVKPSRWGLRTFTGISVNIQGEAEINRLHPRHRSLVADSKEDEIVGTDVMYLIGF